MSRAEYAGFSGMKDQLGPVGHGDRYAIALLDAQFLERTRERVRLRGRRRPRPGAGAELQEHIVGPLLTLCVESCGNP